MTPGDATTIVGWIREELERQRTTAGEVWVRPICTAFEAGSQDLAVTRCMRFLHNVLPRERDEQIFESILDARQDEAGMERLATVSWPERIDRTLISSALAQHDLEGLERALGIDSPTRLRVYGKRLLEALQK